MYQQFIDKCEELLLNFKETGEIESLLLLESYLSNFLDYAVDDYLDEINDSNTTHSVPASHFNWNSNNTL